VLAFRGGDAAKFLQGQLSADVEKLAIGATTLAGLHNPQGRVIAILALLRTAADELLAVLPRELMGIVEPRLRKYILRAKVRIENLSDGILIAGSVTRPPADPLIPSLPWTDRWLSLIPADRHPLLDDQPESLANWQLSDIAQGLPQVYAATSEAFVAQMLNLDLLGAIAFDKGCYTGQEVIARAHYRGRVKRRLQRWLNGSGTALKPSDAARAADGRALIVVRVATRADGQQEILAVGNYAAVTGPAAEAPAAAEAAGAEVSGPLPLPYALPE